MDNSLLLKIGLISLPFLSLSVYAIINIIKINSTLKKKDKETNRKLKMERNIKKRPDTNVYDLKARRKNENI